MHALSAAVHAVLVSRAVSTANQARLRELLEFVESVRKDEGVLLQLTPEAMDLFRAGVEDRPAVCYQCVVAMAPKMPALGLIDTALHPGRAAARAVFTVLHSITRRWTRPILVGLQRRPRGTCGNWCALSGRVRC